MRDAVIWNLDKVLNDQSPQFDSKQLAQVRARIPTLVGYKKIDKNTVELTTRIVNSLFPYDMSYVFYSSPANWEKQGKDWNKVALNPSGTGPFKVDRVVPRERMELSRNADYWDKARVPKLDRVILFPMPEAATRTAALLAGQVDWIESAGARCDPAPQAGRHDHRHQQVPAQLGLSAQHWSKARRGPTSACARRPISPSTAPASTSCWAA